MRLIFIVTQPPGRDHEPNPTPMRDTLKALASSQVSAWLDRPILATLGGHPSFFIQGDLR
jgi:hypothetical protein